MNKCRAKFWVRFFKHTCGRNAKFDKCGVTLCGTHYNQIKDKDEESAKGLMSSWWGIELKEPAKEVRG